MIFIERNRIDSFGNPIKPNEDWFEKAKEATDLALIEKENHNPLSYIYQHLQVKIALEKLFEYKCAYCENQLEESGWNVEHYRPKKRVFERPDHTGYYWLIYDWDNLFPSCIPCNQKRKDIPIWDNQTWGITSGKADHFPIRDERNRVMVPENNLKNEEPLLLNPCKDNPEEYLTFDVLGKILDVKDDKKASESIKYYNLNRKRLKRKRKFIIEVAIEFLQVIIECKEKGDLIYKKLEEMFEKNCCSNSCIFAACARSVKKDPSNFGISVN